MCPHVEQEIHIARPLFGGWFGVWTSTDKWRRHTYSTYRGGGGGGGGGTLVLCKTPRVSVFGPHTGESLAEAKWAKVNKSGHYVWAPVNSCSLVSLCFKKRGGRCDHEESPCLFFSSHYRGGLALLHPSTPLFPPPLLLLYPLFLLSRSPSFSFLSLLPVSLPSLSLVILLLSVLLRLSAVPLADVKTPSFARPVFLKHAGRERSVVSSERELHSWI